MPHVADHINSLSSLARRMHEQIGVLISHSGERGRSSEHVVRGLLRAVLPKRFSIGTGLIVSANGESSRQTDIVIYDDFHNASPALVGDVGVFPVECVYAAIEVKSRLDKESLSASAEAIGKLRKMRKYYRVPTVEIDPQRKTISTGSEILESKLAPRTYLFAFDSDYSNINTVIANMHNCAGEHGAHFHGVLILSKDWFVRQRPYVVPPGFKFATADGAIHFCREVLRGINDFEMYPAAIEKHLGDYTSLREWKAD